LNITTYEAGVLPEFGGILEVVGQHQEVYNRFMYKCYFSYKVTSNPSKNDLFDSRFLVSFNAHLQLTLNQKFSSDYLKYRVLADLALSDKKEYYARVLLAVDDPSADDKIMAIQRSLNQGFIDCSPHVEFFFGKEFLHKKLKSDAKFDFPDSPDIPVIRRSDPICFGELEV